MPLQQPAPFLSMAVRNGCAVIWKIVLVVEFPGLSNGARYQIHLELQLFETANVMSHSLTFMTILLLIEYVILQTTEAYNTRCRSAGVWPVRAQNPSGAGVAGRGRCLRRGYSRTGEEACAPSHFIPRLAGNDNNSWAMVDVMAYAMVAGRTGGSEVLRRVDITPPTPTEGEVLIRQTAIGVNFIDVYFRSGVYPWPVPKDLTLGSEGAGVVEATGPGVTGFAAGDRVAYTVPNGAYASQRVVPAATLVHLPDGVSDQQAAGAMLKGLTAYYLLNDSYPAAKGETVLFHAAAGGVGLLAGQWLAARGVRAIGTAGGAAKGQLALQNGYDAVIDYRTENFVARVAELTGGARVAAVYDSVGKDTIMGSLDCLETFGTLVSFGQSSGAPDQFRISHLARGSLRLQRPTLFHYTASRDWLETASTALFGAIADGTLQINIASTRPLAEVAAVHDDLEARRTTGSTVLIP